MGRVPIVRHIVSVFEWLSSIRKRKKKIKRMPTIIPADSVSSLSSRSLGDPFVEIAWLSTVTLEQYERLIERDDSFAYAVLRWLAGWFYKNERASTEEESNMRDISVENFMTKLETGVILCRMAQLLVGQARNLGRPILNKCVPAFEFKPWMHASPRSFYARDNVENFTRWCRKFGVHESVLFESDGLVMHQAPRYVLLVLLELCRLCAQLGVDPPSVEAQRRNEKARIQEELERTRRLEQEEKERIEKEEIERIKRQQMLEAARREQAELERALEERRLQEEREKREAEQIELRKIAEEQEEREEERLRQELEAIRRRELHSSGTFEELSTSPIAPDSGIGTPTAVCYAESVMVNYVDDDDDDGDQLSGSTDEVGVSLSFRSRLPVPVGGIKPEPAPQPTSILDEKVNTIVNKVLKGAKLHRLSEGKYLINNRPFLVRLLNEKQVMVRVGGGWKSLEEMLRPRSGGRQSSANLKKAAGFENSSSSDPISVLKSLPKARIVSSPYAFLSASKPKTLESPRSTMVSRPLMARSTTSLKSDATGVTVTLDTPRLRSVTTSRIPVGDSHRPRWK